MRKPSIARMKPTDCGWRMYPQNTGHRQVVGGIWECGRPRNRRSLSSVIAGSLAMPANVGALFHRRQALPLVDHVAAGANQSGQPTAAAGVACLRRRQTGRHCHKQLWDRWRDES